MIRPLTLLATLSVCALLCGMAAGATIFDNGAPDGRIGLASRPAGAGAMEIETADDFAFGNSFMITGATFTGLMPVGATIGFVGVELYRLFPADSDTVRMIQVPTRTGSPSDNAFDSRDTGAGNLTFTTSFPGLVSAASNSIVNGINKSPGQTTGGEGPVSGLQEVVFTVNFATPFSLPAGRYFFKPEAGLSTGTFLWLSSPRPTPPPGVTDLQAWIRNTNLDPDWLRAGTDIIGGTTFNAAFTLQGTVIPEPSTLALILGGAALIAWKRKRLSL